MIRSVLIGAMVSLALMPGRAALAADLTADVVLEAIQRSQRVLANQQNENGSWGDPNDSHVIGVTSLATLALLNSGMSRNDPPVRRALGYLRRLPSREPSKTYDASLVIMALVAAKDPARVDAARIASLAQFLESIQIRDDGGGRWSYGANGGGGDGSNSQFAVLGLREAVEAGAVVDRKVWEASRIYWESLQNADGGFGYGPSHPSTGSMTAAGISSLTIIEHMLRSDDGVTADGTPPCCKPDPPNEALERGLKWMGNRFAVGHNPNSSKGQSSWLLYYLYGMERAGRLSGRRFFGEHDWYREGAAFLLDNQQRTGGWRGVGPVRGGE